jgi:hypothetical protein
MKPLAAVPDNSAEGRRLAGQRDLAMVCAILMTAVSVTLAWNNFGRLVPDLEETLAEVRHHQDLLAEHHKIMDSVNAALRANRQELEKINQRKRASP